MNRHDGTFITGALLPVLSGLAMRPVLKPYAPVRSLGDLVLRVAECLAVVAAGVYFLTSRSQWNDYALPVCALSGAAGLFLASALLTSRLAPRGLSLLGIAFPLLLIVRGPSKAVPASCPSAWAGRVSRDDPEITHVGAGHGIARSGPQG